MLNRCVAMGRCSVKGFPTIHCNKEEVSDLVGRLSPTSGRCLWTLLFSTDVIWVILSVEVGGLLGVTQQLSSFETEFNTQPQRNVQEDFNPFASPQKNKHDATDDSFRDPGGAWERTQEPIQQDENGLSLSHNAVNRASNGLQTNLSVVTYGQVCVRHILQYAKRSPWTRKNYFHYTDEVGLFRAPFSYRECNGGTTSPLVYVVCKRELV